MKTMLEWIAFVVLLAAIALGLVLMILLAPFLWPWFMPREEVSRRCGVLWRKKYL